MTLNAPSAAEPGRVTASVPMQDESAAAVHVLVVDDEPGLRRTLVRLLDARGFRVGAVENGVEGLAYIEEHRPDVALVDMQMPKMGGLELLACSKKAGLPTEIIVMTANAGVDAAVEAVKGGAYYFLTKPFVSTEAVALVVAQAAQRKRLLDKTHRLEQRLEAQERFGGLIGNSARMRAVYKLIEGVATATSAVLIVGETGTGKELVARAIHQRSARSDKPFVALNCAAIPRELVESELFGHVRGAFTGAQNARAGLFETAHTGTIFLDEVGDLPLAAQVKLLRTLQEGEIKRVGADETKLVDVRVVSATNVDLKTCIAAGTFRSDLFYRLNVIAIEIPPLRERGEDILLLAHHFIHKYSRRMAREPRPLSPEAAGALGTYAWPGNVRELEHAIERAVVLAPGPSIAQSDLPSEVQRAQGAVTSRPIASSAAPVEDAPTMGEELANLPYAEAKRVAMARFEEVYLEAVLRRAGGNLSEAARQAGVDRSNFKRLVRKGKV